MRLSKDKLDFLGTVFGLIAGVSAVLGTYEVISPKTAGTVGGVAGVLLGIVTQRPADQHPTTQEIEKERLSNYGNFN